MTVVHVAVGIILNANSKILVALRPKHVDQGDLWEFPGGKVEANETPYQALVRELHEEIGIRVQQATFLFQFEHEYPNKKVLIDVWRVEKFSGEPYAKENQAIVKWVSIGQLQLLKMPVANQYITKFSRSFLPPV